MFVRSSLVCLTTNSMSKPRSEFHASSVSFLGFVISEGQVYMDPKKVIAVADWPIPTSRKEVC